MTTFSKQFGVGPPKDLFYPNVLTPDLQLNAGAVQDSFRRAFDAIYTINPPDGSRTPSSVLDTTGFIDQFVVNLDNNVVTLSGENWDANTTQVAWNSHTLTYHGTQYTIAAGSTANKYIYWTLPTSGIYNSSATFPNLSDVNPDDGSVASALIAVFDNTSGKLYPFWSAKMAVSFIATALIEDAAITTAKIQDLAVSTAKIANLAVTTAKIDNLAVTTAKIDNLAVTNAKVNDLAADKITTGTLAASVAITLTRSDTVPAKFIWQSTAEMYAITTGGILVLQPLSTTVPTLNFGGSGDLWYSIGGWASNDVSFTAATSYKTELTTTGFRIYTGNVAGIFTNPFIFTSAKLDAPNTTCDIGSGTAFRNINYSGALTGPYFTTLSASANTILNGLSTDVSGGGLHVALGNGAGFVAADASTNAATISLTVVSGSYGSLNCGKTGSGTRLPMAFFTGGAEAARFDTSQNFNMNALLAKYNNISTVSEGISYQVATVNTTGLTANVGSTTMYAVPASGAGMYVFDAYVVPTATTNGTMPAVIVGWTDSDTGVSTTANGTFSVTNPNNGVAYAGYPVVIYAKASTNITYSTTGYVAGTPTTTYNIRLRLRRQGA